MEYLIIIGGILSMPVIHYCIQPVPPEKVEDNEKDDKNIKKEVEQVSEEELKKAKERAEARKERILKQLNPKEQELFKEYINEMLHPSDKPSYEKCINLSIIFVFLAVLIVAIYIIVQKGPDAIKFDL
ncbi:hypothetical protein SteCoe_12704 [Stentor coeruleus]|uniref:Uncharacterized protein n=1 Tax=Stentor coeruleus TaxID=5963 RepID=A0A1R2CA31_9CILI|nr:hypothetical protein SteCoe_12704 [Stentor coeruleus]